MLESKRRAIIFFIIAVLLAALSGYFVLQKVRELNADLGTMETIYVANRDIYSRAIISPQDVTTTEIPAKYLRDEYITDIEQFRNMVSIVPLSPGDIITKNMLKQASAVTEEDNRLITILQSQNVYFDEMLSDLDRVDIIVSQEVEGKKVTEVFMTDVKVARVALHPETKEFNGVQVEIDFDDVTDLIHMLHYAETVRIIRANVGQMPANVIPPGEDNTDEENPPAVRENNEGNANDSNEIQDDEPNGDQEQDEDSSEEEDNSSENQQDETEEENSADSNQ